MIPAGGRRDMIQINRIGNCQQRQSFFGNAPIRKHLMPLRGKENIRRWQKTEARIRPLRNRRNNVVDIM